MNKELLTDILKELGGEKMVFPYYAGRYAPLLLGMAYGDAAADQVLRPSAGGLAERLMRKPILQQAVRDAHGAPLRVGDLDLVWDDPCEWYRLTLDSWGEADRDTWWQTSRPGWNLVLQMNFSAEHDRQFRSLVKPGRCSPFGSYSHPVHKKGRQTLAWSRIDLDLEQGEALIEEVQNDWLRKADHGVKTVRSYHGRRSQRLRRRVESLFWDTRCRPRELYRYVDEVLKNHRSFWAEAMLSAAVWFLRERLGIREIYYHTSLWGSRLKGLDEDWGPPFSLYEGLPKKLGFTRRRGLPRFLERTKRGVRRRRSWRREGPEFWYLAL
ncbi:hypothetical protein ABI59_11555 [Acidobacteria bacterium Mor1]|nr:hypothetical protein ABI59_11555 [Acidobacteria bacterium Mor1]